MAKKRRPPVDIKVVPRKSTPLTRLVILTAVVLSIAALLAVHGAIRAANRSTEELRQEAIALEQEQARLMIMPMSNYNRLLTQLYNIALIK